MYLNPKIYIDVQSSVFYESQEYNSPQIDHFLNQLPNPTLKPVLRQFFEDKRHLNSPLESLIKTAQQKDPLFSSKDILSRVQLGWLKKFTPSHELFILCSSFQKQLKGDNVVFFTSNPEPLRYFFQSFFIENSYGKQLERLSQLTFEKGSYVITKRCAVVKEKIPDHSNIEIVYFDNLIPHPSESQLQSEANDWAHSLDLLNLDSVLQRVQTL